MIRDKIGLEAEFLVVDKDQKLVLPSMAGIPTDDLVILAECRGLPGQDVPEAVSNFQREYMRLIGLIKAAGLFPLLPPEGWIPVEPEFYAQILKDSARGKLESLNNKGEIENVYGKNINRLSDQEVVNGEIRTINLSCGLHVHFSSEASEERKVSREKLEPVSLPLNVQGAEISLSLYRKAGYIEEGVVKATASRITNPVIQKIVRFFDESILPTYPASKPLRHRQPGFFRRKPYGFEYRSLPFSPATLKNLGEITEAAFTQLNEL